MWRYSIDGNTWTHVSGNKTINVHSDYNNPYPGGLLCHSMSSNQDNIYIFGGYGINNSNKGIWNIYDSCKVI